MTLIQEFSSGYYIAPEVCVEVFSGENAAVPQDLYESIRKVVGAPMYGVVGGVRFEIHPEPGIPADTVALPKSLYSYHDEVLLIERPGPGTRFL